MTYFLLHRKVIHTSHAIKRISDEAILSFVYRGLVARGPAGSAIKRIADAAFLSDYESKVSISFNQSS